jgi:hypothetical protein
MPIIPEFDPPPASPKQERTDPLIICTIDPVNDRGNPGCAHCGWEGGAGHGQLKRTPAAWDDPVPPIDPFGGPPAPPYPGRSWP